MEGSVFIMTGNTVIFVTDKRQGNLAAYLPGKVRLLDWRRGFENKEAHKILEGSRQVILPVPVAKIERNHDVNKFLKEELTKEKIAVHMQFNHYVTTMPIKYIMEAILNTKIKENKELQDLISFFDFKPCLSKSVRPGVQSGVETAV